MKLSYTKNSPFSRVGKFIKYKEIRDGECFLFHPDSYIQKRLGNDHYFWHPIRKWILHARNAWPNSDPYTSYMIVSNPKDDV